MNIKLSQLPRCNTCDHWGYIKNAAGNGCKKISYGNHVNPDGVTYQDYEGYNAWHKTGSNFGCIHHSSILIDNEHDNEDHLS